MPTNESLLIVDPDARSLRVLEVSLRKAGFSISTAENADEAWRMALEAPPSMVITDTQLPDESGFSLCDRLRTEPSTADSARTLPMSTSTATAAAGRSHDVSFVPSL